MVHIRRVTFQGTRQNNIQNYMANDSRGVGDVPDFDIPGYPITAIGGRSVDGWIFVDIQPKMFHAKLPTILGCLAPGLDHWPCTIELKSHSAVRISKEGSN